jgi:geranylgeranyl diphosphate synthase type II
MMIHLQGVLSGRAGARLRRFLGQSRGERPDSEVEWVYGQMREHGSLEAARAQAQELADAARSEAETALAEATDGPDKDFLMALPGYVISRSH